MVRYSRLEQLESLLKVYEMQNAVCEFYPVPVEAAVSSNRRLGVFQVALNLSTIITALCDTALHGKKRQYQRLSRSVECLARALQTVQSVYRGLNSTTDLLCRWHWTTNPRTVQYQMLQRFLNLIASILEVPLIGSA